MPEAGVVAVVSRAAVQRQAAASLRGRQLVNQRARHHARKPDGYNLTTMIEIVVIARTTGMMRVKIARTIKTMHVKIARTTLMTSGMTTIMIIMVAQPLLPGWPWGRRPVPTT
jgi:hypothetical protein